MSSDTSTHSAAPTDGFNPTAVPSTGAESTASAASGKQSVVFKKCPVRVTADGRKYTTDDDPDAQTVTMTEPSTGTDASPEDIAWGGSLQGMNAMMRMAVFSKDESQRTEFEGHLDKFVQSKNVEAGVGKLQEKWRYISRGELTAPDGTVSRSEATPTAESKRKRWNEWARLHRSQARQASTPSASAATSGLAPASQGATATASGIGTRDESAVSSGGPPTLSSEQMDEVFMSVNGTAMGGSMTAPTTSAISVA